MAYDGTLKTRIRLTQDQLDRVCERHVHFMEGRPGGARANLPFFDLSGLNLSNRNLTGAHLAGVALTQIDMKEQARYGYGDAGYYYGEYKKYYAS